MKEATSNGTRHRNRWPVKAARAVGLATVIAIAVTWAGATYDHPVDGAIMAGLRSSQCGATRAMQAGSLLTAMPPEQDICRALFLYRGNVSNISDDERTYRLAVLQARLDEFRQLWMYVWILTMAATGGAYGLFAGGRALWRRARPAPRRARLPRVPRHKAGEAAFATDVEYDQSY